MWTLTKTFRFEAAHCLPLHDGACARPHGHSYGLTVECMGTILCVEGPQSGMVLDYGRISRAVQPLVEVSLDHQDLNQTLGIPQTTAEGIAQWVYERLLPGLPSLVAVTIQETSTSGCRYAPVRHQ
jgi:6-pyruvoyltetrahydropterin/6-carboxytetrahydropterin synthase